MDSILYFSKDAVYSNTEIFGVNPLPDFPILSSFNSAANQDMKSKV